MMGLVHLFLLLIFFAPLAIAVGMSSRCRRRRPVLAALLPAEFFTVN